MPRFIRLDITPEVRRKVYLYYREKYIPSGATNHHDAGFDGSDNRDVTGLFGEITVVLYLGRSVDEFLAKKPLGGPDNGKDILINGLWWDIKSKCRNVKTMRGDYECSVAVDQHINSLAYGYIFCNVHSDYSIGCVAGYKTKGDYEKNSRWCHKGEKDLSNNFVFPCDAYNMRYDQLDDIKTIYSHPEQLSFF